MKILRSRYRNYLTILVIITLGVIACFKIIPDKKIASLVTSALFLGSSVWIIFRESRFPGFLRRPTFFGVIFFVLSSVVPTLVIRYYSWEGEFNTTYLFGFSGKQIHEFSNIIFFIMVFCIFIDSYVENRKRLLAKNKETTSEAASFSRKS